MRLYIRAADPRHSFHLFKRDDFTIVIAGASALPFWILVRYLINECEKFNTQIQNDTHCRLAQIANKPSNLSRPLNTSSASSRSSHIPVSPTATKKSHNHPEPPQFLAHQAKHWMEMLRGFSAMNHPTPPRSHISPLLPPPALDSPKLADFYLII